MTNKSSSLAMNVNACWLQTKPLKAKTPLMRFLPLAILGTGFFSIALSCGAVHAASANSAPVKLSSPKPGVPKNADMIHERPMSERERQLLSLQQATQAKYIESTNQLSLLKLMLEIEKTNEGISAAKLAIIKNQKELVDLLAPPEKKEATASTANYARGLDAGMGPSEGVQQAQRQQNMQQGSFRPVATQRQQVQTAINTVRQSARAAIPEPQPLSAAERQNMLANMSAQMRDEYEKMSAQLSQKQKDAFLRMSPEEQKSVAAMPPAEKEAFIAMPPEQQTAYVAMPPGQKEEFNKLSAAEKQEFVAMPPAEKEAFLKLPPEEKQAFISMPPQQKAAYVKMDPSEKKTFMAMPPSEKEKVAAIVAPEAAASAPLLTESGEPVPVLPYSVVSVAKLRGVWTAVIGGANTLFSVQVGDVLPPDNSVVRRISRDGVTLETGGQVRKVSLVPII